jgi:glycosyltransferase involved in cell wall biosynthesis
MNASNNPLVSIVIPTYNHAHFLEYALQSVLDQTYTNWEVIIIDNHSQDDTDEVVGRFENSKVKLLKIHNNGVIAASRNMGVNVAKGEWIAFLDSDDRWTPNKLQVCLANFNENAELIYHDLQIVRDHHDIFQRKKVKSRQLKSPVLIDLLVNGNVISNSSVIVRKRLLDQIGGIDENSKMIAAEDYNVWLRAAQITNHFFYIPEILGFYFQHNQGISRQDMSIPSRYACSEFIHTLNSQQKLKMESNLRYMAGRFAFVSGDFRNARKDLLFCLYFGNLFIKLKSIFMLLVSLKSMRW